LAESGRAAVFVDQAAEYIDPFDSRDRPGGRVGGRVGGLGRQERSVEVVASVGSSGVVVRDIGIQDPLEMTPIPHQHPVQAFDACCAHPSLGVGVRPGRPRWDLEDIDAGSGERGVEAGGELGVPIADQ
jgi:hypothetical protein